MSETPGDLFFVLTAGFGLLTSTLTLILNSAVLIIIVTIRQCHTVSNLLVCSSCVASILYSILAFVDSVYCMREDWAFEQPACVLKAFLSVLVLTALTYSYSMQALSRVFFAIFYKHRFLLSWRTHAIMIGCTWFLSLLVPIAPLLIEGGLGLERESRICGVSSKVFSAAAWCVVIIFCIPLSVVVMVYVMIVQHVRQSARRVMPGTSNVHMHNAGHQAKRELKLMQLLVLQTVSFSCGGVVYLINILWQALSQAPLPKPLYSIGFSLMTFSMTSSGINHFLFNKQVRDAAVNYLRRFC